MFNRVNYQKQHQITIMGGCLSVVWSEASLFDNRTPKGRWGLEETEV